MQSKTKKILMIFVGLIFIDIIVVFIYNMIMSSKEEVKSNFIEITSEQDEKYGQKIPIDGLEWGMTSKEVFELLGVTREDLEIVSQDNSYQIVYCLDKDMEVLGKEVDAVYFTFIANAVTSQIANWGEDMQVLLKNFCEREDLLYSLEIDFNVTSDELVKSLNSEYGEGFIYTITESEIPVYKWTDGLTMYDVKNKAVRQVLYNILVNNQKNEEYISEAFAYELNYIMAAEIEDTDSKQSRIKMSGGYAVQLNAIQKSIDIAKSEQEIIKKYEEDDYNIIPVNENYKLENNIEVYVKSIVVGNEETYLNYVLKKNENISGINLEITITDTDKNSYNMGTKRQILIQKGDTLYQGVFAGELKQKSISKIDIKVS